MKLLLLFVPLVLAYADVTTETFTRAKMVGGIVTTEIAARIDLRSEMRSEDQQVVVNAVIRGKPEHLGEITRLDKELIWKINHPNKSYTESPLRRPETGTQVETKVEGAPDTAQKYRVVKTEFSVRKLDSARTINGFPCTGYIAKWTVVVEEIETSRQSTSIMTLTEWTTPLTDVLKQAQAAEETWSKAYAAKLGHTAMPDAEQGRLGMAYLAAMGITDKQLGDGLRNAGTELAKIQGYPIITEVKWQAQGDTSETARETEPEKPGRSGGLPSVSGILGKAIADKIAPKPSAADKDVLFSTYREIKSVRVGATTDTNYEVPAGYKKVR
jgi:hypothetical protein